MPWADSSGPSDTWPETTLTLSSDHSEQIAIIVAWRSPATFKDGVSLAAKKILCPVSSLPKPVMRPPGPEIAHLGPCFVEKQDISQVIEITLLNGLISKKSCCDALLIATIRQKFPVTVIPHAPSPGRDWPPDGCRKRGRSSANRETQIGMDGRSGAATPPTVPDGCWGKVGDPGPIG